MWCKELCKFMSHQFTNELTVMSPSHLKVCSHDAIVSLSQLSEVFPKIDYSGNSARIVLQ